AGSEKLTVTVRVGAVESLKRPIRSRSQSPARDCSSRSIDRWLRILRDYNTAMQLSFGRRTLLFISVSL
ncbi:hypothetical protein TSAR_008870, partial [Trichomalopsis sarcophagae]